MTVKTTGAEFKLFYDDDAWWAFGMLHEDEKITINGLPCDDNVDFLTIPDDAVVTVSGGVMLFMPNDEDVTFEKYFKRWRKKQSKVSIVIECDKDAVEAIKAAVKAVGGRIK